LSPSLLFSSSLSLSSSLLSLESRNENLCATGLFEHFQEWRCTPIGNILGEGIPKALDGQQVTLTDSLITKLGLDAMNDDSDSNRMIPSLLDNITTSSAAGVNGNRKGSNQGSN